MYKEALLHCAELKLLPYTVRLVEIHGFRELRPVDGVLCLVCCIHHYQSSPTRAHSLKKLSNHQYIFIMKLRIRVID
jgi:hypothetical protein